jgi:TonB-linked SusC/RagA family outer membrane protein
MQLNVCRSLFHIKRKADIKILLFMKMTTIIMLALCINASAKGYSQKITISQKNVSLEKVFKEISRQTGYTFIYTESLLKKSKKITISVTNESLERALEKSFLDQPLTYTILNKLIIIKEKEIIQKPIYSQKLSVDIKGKVLDEKGEPLQGASVHIKGKNIGTVTNSFGEFQLNNIDENDILVISFLGYTNVEQKVGKEVSITITMKLVNENLSAVTVIGYGTQSKRNVTGSISSLKSDDLKDQVISSFDQAMAGKLAGVRVSAASGEPGRNAEINIRGIGTLTAGSQPLVVIDGFPLPEGSGLSSINPIDIESIEVLKDAASAAIYGSRGANGIILVTTKKGKSGKAVINYNSYAGIQRVAKKIDFMDAYELAQYTAVGRNNAWVDLNPTTNSINDPNHIRPDRFKIPEYMLPYLEGKEGLINTDWQDALFRNAPIQNHDISVSGANESIRYFLSGNFFNQKGIVVGSDFKRYSFRVNLETTLGNKINLGLNLNPSYSESDLITEGGHGEDGVQLAMFMSQPMFPVYNPDGSLAISNQIREGGKYNMRRVENPVALATLTDHSLMRYNLISGIYLDYEIINGLKFKTQLAGNFASSQEDYYRPSFLGTYNAAAPSTAIGKKNSGRINNILIENTIGYNTKLNNHHFSTIGGYSYQKENSFVDFIAANNFPNDNIRTLNAGNIIPSQTFTTSYEWAMISYFGRMQYNYKNKYLLSTSLRSDGSSRFGENSKWALFPSVSLGWRISEESFLKNLEVINEFKIRGSWGKTGNNLIPNYGSKALLTQSNYILGGSLINGFRQSTAPNPELSWETNEMYNIGFDLTLFNNRLNIITEYYYSITKDLLLEVPVPASSGYSSSLRNFGKISNTGIEFSLNTNNQFGRLTWLSGFNISTNKNKVLQLGPGQDQIASVYMHITRVGEPLGSFYGYRVIGVFQNADELSSYPKPAGSAVGSYKYEDVNKDGKIDQNDRTILGNFFPDYTFGFNNNLKFKGIDFNVLIQGAQNFKMFQNGAFANLTTSVDANMFKDYVDNYFISEGNPNNGKYARPTYAGNLLFQDSDFKLKDASFVRVRSISLGYTLPNSIFKSDFTKNIRLYISTLNPFTITRYPGYNPEANPKPNGFGVLNPGMDWSAYPIEKSLVFGVNVTF